MEFQPDLKNPQKPVRLGLVLHEVKDTGESSFIVIGRMPRMEARPREFEHTSQLAMEIASKWVDVMGKQALDAPANDLFARLADNWHWNLYLTAPAGTRILGRASLDSLAKMLFRRFVGEPFARSTARPKAPKAVRSRSPISTPSVLPDDMPPAWLLNEVMQHSLGVRT